MQYKEGDRVEIKAAMVEGQGTVAKDCEDKEWRVWVILNGAKKAIRVPVENLELVFPSASITRYVWRNDTFEGRYPVGTAALVIAKTQGRATYLLNAELRRRGLPGDVKPEEMVLTLPDEEQVIILNEGVY